jgi:hypothetical protein
MSNTSSISCRNIRMSNVSSISCRNIRWDITPNEQCFIYIMPEHSMRYNAYEQCFIFIMLELSMRYNAKWAILHLYHVISHRMFRHDIDETLFIWRYISSDVPAWYRWNIAHLALYLIECSGISISWRNIRWDITPYEQCFIYVMPEHSMRYNAKCAMFHLYHAGTFDEI